MDDDKLLCGNNDTTNKTTVAILVDCKKSGLEVSTVKTKQHKQQNSGQNENMKTASTFFQNVEKFKVWELTNQNCFYEESKSVLESVNAC